MCTIVISMLCVYYRLELPDLQDVSQYTDEKFNTLFMQKMDLHYDYLFAVTNLNYEHPIIFTSKIKNLIEIWKNIRLALKVQNVNSQQ